MGHGLGHVQRAVLSALQDHEQTPERERGVGAIEIAAIVYPSQPVSEAKLVVVRRVLAAWERRRLIVRLERSGGRDRWRVNVREQPTPRAA